MRSALVLALGAACLLAADTPTDEAGTAAAVNPVMAKIESLGLRERVSHLMLVTLQGRYGPNAPDRELLKECTPGGVIIPQGMEPRYAAEYIVDLRALPAEQKTGIPLFIGTDLYSFTQGVRNVPSTFVQLPSLLCVAAAADERASERMAGLVAEHLAIMGFNMSLGPSLELAPRLSGATGALQTLGSDPRFAAEAGGAILDALEADGILAVPTGFPGGGADRLPRNPAALLTPRKILREQDLAPYIRAIERGVPIIHVANTLAPTIDPGSRPASLSPAVMRDLLRGELMFSGVIVAGPIDAPDIRRLHDPAMAAVLAMASGADMVYWAEGGERVMKGVDAIVKAVEKGGLNDTAINASLARVLALKQDRKLLERKRPSPKEADALAKKKRYSEEAYEIERRSITLVQNRGSVLPLTAKRSVPIGITGTVGVEELKKALGKHIKQVVMQPISSAKHLGDIEDFEIRRLTSHIEGIRTVVCVLTNTPKTGGQVRLLRELRDAGVKLVVVLLGYPKNLPVLADADAVVLGYSQGPDIALSMMAVADVLAGMGPLGILGSGRDWTTRTGKTETFSIQDLVRAPAGRLPVTIGDRFTAGYAVGYDPSFNVKKAEWDFADGTRASGLQVSHAFAEAGRYPVTLSVTDKNNELTEATLNVVVE